MASEPFVAIRAICNRILVGGAWTGQGAGHGRRSSVFVSGRDANASLRGFHQSVMVPHWEDLRIQLLTQPYVRWPSQTLHGRVMGYARVPGPVRPMTALPTYLNGRYGLAGCAGNDPLYPRDPRLATGIPMSAPTDPETFLVAVEPDPNAPGGWYVNSAYPE